MAGLDPSDPRFEKAVHHALKFFPDSVLPWAEREEMAQEIRIALWQRGGGSPYHVARFKAIDCWRHRCGRGSHQRPLQVELEDHLVGEDAPQTPQVEELLELEALIRKLFEVLGTREATSILLYHRDEVPMHQIAVRLGVSEARVCQLLEKSRGRLRAEFGRDSTASGKMHHRGRRAREWLKQKLAHGPMLASTLHQLAHAADLCSRSTLISAARELGVLTIGERAKSTWSLPASGPLVAPAPPDSR